MRNRLLILTLIALLIAPLNVLASTQAGITPASATRYAALVTRCFRSPKPDFRDLADLAALLEQADLNDARVKEALAPVADAVNAEARVLLADPENADPLKLKALAHSSIGRLLKDQRVTEDQIAQINAITRKTALALSGSPLDPELPFSYAATQDRLLQAGSCKLGYCHSDVLTLLKRARAAGVSQSPPKTEVLFLFRPAPNLARSLPMLNVRDEGSAAAIYHVVLRHRGLIYDASSLTTAGVPAVAYFRRMFLRSPEDPIAVHPLKSWLDRRAHVKTMKRVAFTEESAMLDEVLVRVIDPFTYIDRIHQLIEQAKGDIEYYWLKMDSEVRAMTLGDYLGQKRRANVPKAPVL
jgi:hypothetical protein